MPTPEQLFTTWIYLPFMSLAQSIEKNPYGLYILIGVFIVLASIKGKNSQTNTTPEKPVKSNIIKRTLPRLVDALTIFAAILIAVVAFQQFKPAFSAFLKPTTTTNTSPSTKTPATNSTRGTQRTPTQNTTPTYQAPKQLYYSVSCSSCWNEGCNHNGYIYNGYDANSYNYYRNVCSVCTCNNVRAQSFWR